MFLKYSNPFKEGKKYLLGKIFYPFDIIANKFGLPAIRPLYNLPLIAKSQEIIFVEGEKCAEAITKLGYCGTTTPGGANAQLEKVDWLPLKDKSLLIWPDNDEAGIKYAERVFNVLKNIAANVSILELPTDKPKKWDCADAIVEGFDIKVFINTAKRLKSIDELYKIKDQTESQKQQKQILTITDWNIRQYSRTPKPTDYLIKNLFPLGVVSMVAAVGDTGKSLLLLDLAIKVAIGSSEECFGNKVCQAGSVVIFTAEDDKSEIERRLQRLDPKGYRFMSNNGFYIIPLQNAFGAFAIIEEKPSNNIYETEVYGNIKKQLLNIKNLKLIVFDPLVSFVNGDITFNSTTSAFLINTLSLLAVETGASVIITHHLRKTNGEINSIDDVREAIRGSSALVNGVRLAYAFWPVKLNRQKEYFKSKEKNFVPNALFNGAVVKANSKVDRDIKIYLRDENGLLKALKSNNNINFETEEFEDTLYNSIIQLNKNNVRITFTGKEGLFERKDLLVEELKNLSKRQIRATAMNLLEKKRIVKSHNGDLVAVMPQEECSLFDYMGDEND